MSGIRVTLSNGERSPYFKANGSQNNHVTLNVNQGLNPKKITMRANLYVHKLIIVDEKNQALCNWDGGNQDDTNR